MGDRLLPEFSLENRQKKCKKETGDRKTKETKQTNKETKGQEEVPDAWDLYHDSVPIYHYVPM
jgi:hypothetical protein